MLRQRQQPKYRHMKLQEVGLKNYRLITMRGAFTSLVSALQSQTEGCSIQLAFKGYLNEFIFGSMAPSVDGFASIESEQYQRKVCLYEHDLRGRVTLENAARILNYVPELTLREVVSSVFCLLLELRPGNYVWPVHHLPGEGSKILQIQFSQRELKLSFAFEDENPSSFQLTPESYRVIIPVY